MDTSSFLQLLFLLVVMGFLFGLWFFATARKKRVNASGIISVGALISGFVGITLYALLYSVLRTDDNHAAFFLSLVFMGGFSAALAICFRYPRLHGRRIRK